MKKIIFISLLILLTSLVFGQASNYQEFSRQAQANLQSYESEFERLRGMVQDHSNNRRFAAFRNDLNALGRDVEAKQREVEMFINRPATKEIIDKSFKELELLMNRYRRKEEEFRDWIASLS